MFVSQAVTSSAGYFNNTPIVRCETQITKTLSRGSENNEVYILQNMLVNSGLLSAHPNGYFGHQTKAAVEAFQHYNNIQATGIVGEATRNAVNERLCDTDLTAIDMYSYDSPYSYVSGVTYVTQNDPFVQVISPTPAAPAVYATPQNISVSPTIASSPYLSQNVTVPSQVINMGTGYSPSSQIVSSGIVYNPASGYTYGVVPQSGMLTVTSPRAGSVYNEGDTVNLVWNTTNLTSTLFSIIIESTITGQQKTIAVTGGNSYSFVLSHELLDSVCAGTCNNNQQGSFKISITTPTTDIAGITSTLKASVASVTIRRVSVPGQVSITASKTPVNSGEVFKLYINIPTGASWNSGLAGNYSIKVRAICSSGVTASIAGTPCGQDFVIPFAPTSFQQEIPAAIVNPTWYKQDVTFQLTVVNLLGQTIGVGETRVTANGAPFSW